MRKNGVGFWSRYLEEVEKVDRRVRKSRHRNQSLLYTKKWEEALYPSANQKTYIMGKLLDSQIESLNALTSRIVIHSRVPMIGVRLYDFGKRFVLKLGEKKKKLA